MKVEVFFVLKENNVMNIQNGGQSPVLPKRQKQFRSLSKGKHDQKTIRQWF